LVTKEDTTAKIVRSSLKSNHRLNLGGVYQEVSELRSYLSDLPAQIVVVDIDPDSSRILYDVGTIVTGYPETHVVVVSSRFDQELLLEAMQAGARHFLRKEFIAPELDEVLERLICTKAERKASLGSIISVFSTSGGCGATTVALNLANELQMASSKAVLTVDLDHCYGTMSVYLGITGRYGIADVLGHKGPIDENLIKSIACNYKEDFHVLISPVSIKDTSSKVLQYENLPEALKACRQVYRYTVVDAPRVPENVVTSLAAMSVFSVIVLQLTVKDLQFAQSLVSSMTQSGIPRDRIMPLANRYKGRGPLVRLEDSKKALGVDSLYRIRSDWRKAMNCINRGQPLADAAPRSGLRRDFRKLAAEIYAYETNGSRIALR